MAGYIKLRIHLKLGGLKLWAICIRVLRLHGKGQSDWFGS